MLRAETKSMQSAYWRAGLSQELRQEPSQTYQGLYAQEFFRKIGKLLKPKCKVRKFIWQWQCKRLLDFTRDFFRSFKTCFCVGIRELLQSGHFKRSITRIFCSTKLWIGVGGPPLFRLPIKTTDFSFVFHKERPMTITKCVNWTLLRSVEPLWAKNIIYLYKLGVGNCDKLDIEWFDMPFGPICPHYRSAK